MKISGSKDDVMRLGILSFAVILLLIGIFSGRFATAKYLGLILVVGTVSMAAYRSKEVTRGVVFYYHNDHLNTPQKMTDEKGNVVWEVTEKRPFGDFNYSAKTVNLKDYTGNTADDWTYTVENPLRFPGQYTEYNYAGIIHKFQEQGPYYNWNRWYGPGQGRYMEEDEIILHGILMQEYNYSNNNSINFYDGTGRWPTGSVPYKPSGGTKHPCASAKPLQPNTPECDKYKCNKYAGTSLKCFCKCAGNSDWANKVRGCLRCADERNEDRYSSHLMCYMAGNKNPSAWPWNDIVYCYLRCMFNSNYR